MIAQSKRSIRARRRSGLNQFIIIGLIVLLICAMITVTYLSQILVERDAFTFNPPLNVSTPKEQYEIAKLAAEIRQIRSDTSGSLFWLKLIALFVTVGGAVGGYLVGQSQITHERLNFEHRKDVDATYQGIVQELSSTEPILRSAAAVKLGSILKAFPVEWNVKDERRDELIQLTKQVLAAALSIEENDKVLKSLTIALVLHKPWENSSTDKEKQRLGDVRELDLSGANACDAYWARVDFSYTDFYRANLELVSFRKSILQGAQFRETKLKDAVLIEANCEGANFKLADLRGADFSQARLFKANFEGAKVHGVNMSGAELGANPNVKVDTSEKGDGSQMVDFADWLAAHAADITRRA
ncbi:MAG TPA: pentapeptide repeat-containing protein [Herpetosiphonaceae bacterium]